MSTSSWPWEQTRGLLLEHLQAHHRGQFGVAVAGVANLAMEKGLYPKPRGWSPSSLGADQLQGNDRANVTELVRQLLWQLVVQGVLVPGMDENNANWPWYRLTDYGVRFLDGRAPQPHDPDGFLRHFDNENPDADPVVREYLDEALRTFNANCPKASAVMLGAASEKLVLLLHDRFEDAISDPAMKKKFQKMYGLTISSKYNALKRGLDHMIEKKRFPPRSPEYSETINNALGGVFQMLRRLRNAAGHPDLLVPMTRENLFLNLCVFSEYHRAVASVLIEYFTTNAAEPF